MTPHKGDYELFWQRTNWQGLCFKHHSEKTAREDGGFGNVALQPSWLPMPAVPLHVVLGPPGSGKSTYVRERAKPNELVLDLDELIAGLSGRPLYQREDKDWRAAIRYRNHLLAGLADPNGEWEAAWLIVSKGQAFWSRFAASVYTMPTSKDTCIERIMGDARRPEHVKRIHRAVLDRWAWG